MKVVLHIGMHKTGTTFLQKEVFPKAANYVFLRNKNMTSFYHPYRKEGDRNFLISDEIISGNPYAEDTMADFEYKIGALSQLFPNAIILVAFRKHESYITSVYNQYLQQGGNMTIHEFFNLDNSGILKIEDITYRYRIERLQAIFNEVQVYDYASFKSDPEKTTLKICEKLGLVLKSEIDYNIQHNQSIQSELQHKTLKRLNRINDALGGFMTNKYFKRWNLTPRKIAQRRLKGVESKKWAPDKSYITEIEQHFQADWGTVLQQVSIKL